MVGMPWSMPPSRSRTTVIPCSSTYRQSSILGERYRQPASSRQMMFISEAPPLEFFLLGIPEDVERVALVVVQVEPHPLAAPPAGPCLVAQRLDGDLGVRGAEGVLTAPLHGELQRPDRGARGERAVHDPHHDVVLAGTEEGEIRAPVLVEVGLDDALGAPLHGRIVLPGDVDRRPGGMQPRAARAESEEQQAGLESEIWFRERAQDCPSGGGSYREAGRGLATLPFRKYCSIITAAMFPVPIATATCWVMGRRSPAIQTPGTLVSPRWDLGLACLPVEAISTPSCWARSVRPRASLETKKASAVSVVPSLSSRPVRLRFSPISRWISPVSTGMLFSRSRAAQGSERSRPPARSTRMRPV